MTPRFVFTIDLAQNTNRLPGGRIFYTYRHDCAPPTAEGTIIDTIAWAHFATAANAQGVWNKR